MNVINGSIEARPVLLDITIQDIYSIREQKSTFDIFFMANFRWFDKRLSFQFLKDDQMKNYIRKARLVAITYLQHRISDELLIQMQSYKALRFM